MLVQGLGLQATVPADDRPVLLRASHFGQYGMLRLVGSRLAECAAAPLPSLFWAAGFSFSRSQLIQEVKHFVQLHFILIICGISNPPFALNFEQLYRL